MGTAPESAISTFTVSSFPPLTETANHQMLEPPLTENWIFPPLLLLLFPVEGKEVTGADVTGAEVGLEVAAFVGVTVEEEPEEEEEEDPEEEEEEEEPAT